MFTPIMVVSLYAFTEHLEEKEPLLQVVLEM